MSSINTLTEDTPEQTPDTSAATRTLDPQELSPIFKDLAQTLGESDTRALEVINQLRNQLRDAGLDPLAEVQAIQDLIEGYEFDAALEKLSKLAQQRGIDLEGQEHA